MEKIKTQEGNDERKEKKTEEKKRMRITIGKRKTVNGGEKDSTKRITISKTSKLDKKKGCKQQNYVGDDEAPHMKRLALFLLDHLGHRT